MLQSPQNFNKGFIPQTWSDANWGGDGNPLDIVDLSNSKPTLTICDFKVLGVMGLVHKGCFDYKIFVMDAEEASSRGINTLKDLKAHEPVKL